MKGLGEMSVEETEQTLTDPTQRIIKQITVEDAAAADILFEQLMGTGIVARKEYIKAHRGLKSGWNKYLYSRIRKTLWRPRR